MKRLFTILASISLLPLMASLYVFFLYLSVDVDQLRTHKPLYDVKSKAYRLTKNSDSWIDSSKVSHIAKWAIVVSEDWAFFEHQGVDYNQLKIVLEEFLETGVLSRGASTISQQVVKNIFLDNERSILRKFKELIITYKLEKKLSKKEILEVYLNLIELGKNIYGIKDASYYYFEKHPSKLTAKEGAFLAMLLPSPRKYSSSFREGKLSEFAKETIHSILIKLRQAKKITEQQRVVFEDESFFWEE